MTDLGWQMSWLALGAVLLGGCAKCSDPAPSPAVSSSAAPSQPRVVAAEQRRLRPDGGVFGTDRRRAATSQEAREIGSRLRQTVSQQCADQKCFHARCAPLCVQWLRERDAGASGRDMYLDCVSSCAFAVDGGG
jgi:hypothetical protein